MELTIFSKKHGLHTVYYDNEDHHLISDYTWHIQKKDKNFYAGSNVYIGNKRSDAVLMHRLLLGNPDNDVDHIDGNGLNNKKKQS